MHLGVILLPFLCLSFLHALPIHPSPSSSSYANNVWTHATQDDRAALVVTTGNPGDSIVYELYVNGIVWLVSAPVNIFCNNEWHNESMKNLVYQGYQWGTGTDPLLGTYKETNATFIAQDPIGDTEVVFSIKGFTEIDLYFFDTIFPNGAKGTGVVPPQTFVGGGTKSLLRDDIEFNSTELVSTKFPSFLASNNTALGSVLGYYEWHGRFSADSSTLGMGLNGYQGGTEGGPLLLFNTGLILDRNNADSLIISPFTHFKDSIGSLRDDVLSFGVQGYATSFPPGFVARFGLSPSQYGINAALDAWGTSLRTFYPVPKLDPALDPVNHKISYWTDNGAFYYGGYWDTYPNANFESILSNLVQYWQSNEIPVGSIQLDPWWYIFEGGAGACASWTVDTHIFPHGSLDYAKSLTPIPFVLYSSYFTPTNNYSEKFTFLDSYNFNVGWAKGQVAIAAPANSFNFYDYIMDSQAPYLGGFEIDFMDFQYLLFSGTITEIDSWRTFLQGSADAALQHNVSIQYCMELPNDILQSIEFASVTSARASEDDFPTNPNRWSIGYTSMLHRAVGLGPFFDNFWTTSVQPGNPYNAYEPNADLATIISTLSAGPVGIGDGVGFTNVSRLQWTCRKDGVILKPSVPAIPIDAQFVPPILGGIPENSYIWSTYAQIGDYITYYVLGVNVSTGYDLVTALLWPASPFMATYWVATYPFTCQNGNLASECGLSQFNDLYPFKIPPQPLNESDPNFLPHALFTISPIYSTGWSFLGEMNKFVVASPQRVSSVSATVAQVEVQAVGAVGENIFFTFVSPTGEVVVKNATVGSSGTVTISAP